MLNYIDFEIPVKIIFLCIVLYTIHCFIQFIEFTIQQCYELFTYIYRKYNIDVNVYNDIMSRFLDESNIIYLLKLTLHDNTIIFKVGKTTQCLLERIKHDKNIVYKSIIPLDIYLVEDDKDLSEIENYFLNKMNQQFSHILDNEYYGGFENQIIDKFSNIKNSI